MRTWPTKSYAAIRSVAESLTRRPGLPLCESRATAAFTMVEIALCLGIIGFALVAIIGILPSGLNVQRDNREETIIKEDAMYLMNAIRGGARGMYDLDSYVVSMTNRFFDAASGREIGYLGYDPRQQRNFTNSIIIGLLSTPKYFPADNVICRGTHIMYAISGSAIEKPPSNARDVAFKYQLTCEVVPIRTISRDMYNFIPPNSTVEDRITRSNLWAQVQEQMVNLYDLRLTFRWPILAGGKTGNNKLVFRTTVSGRLEFADRNDLTGFSAFDGKYDEKRKYYYFAPTGPYTKSP